MPKPDSLDFLSHLEELRKRLLISLLVFVTATIGCYFFSHPLLDFLTGPLRQFNHTSLFFQEPYEAFLTHLKVSSLAGFVISTPVFFTELWLFIAPGLYEREKKIFISLTLISLFLFLIGTFFAYLIIIPWGLHFLLSFQTESLRPLLGVGPYFSFLIGMVLAFGILFDLPVFIIGLVKLRVINTSTLARARKAAIVLIFVAAAILTPSPDPISQTLLALPLILLFEISLAIARRIEKNRL